MAEYFESTSMHIPTRGLLSQLIHSAINKLNLVTREEFAVQTQVLIKTRLRVEQLEKTLTELLEQQAKAQE